EIRAEGIHMKHQLGELELRLARFVAGCRGPAQILLGHRVLAHRKSRVSGARHRRQIMPVACERHAKLYERALIILRLKKQLSSLRMLLRTISQSRRQRD